LGDAHIAADLNSTIDGDVGHRRRFWVPRGTDPDLSDDGFLFDPESKSAQVRGSSELPFEAIANEPVLILLGEPGIGKSTALEAEYDRITSAVTATNKGNLWVDLGRYGSDSLLDRRLLRAKLFRRHEKECNIFLDGFDECINRVPNLPSLLLEFLSKLPPDGLRLRIASRTADWSPELESALFKLWGANSVGVYQLAPLRRVDVYREAEHRGHSPEVFLARVKQFGAGPLASRPITLQFLLDSWIGRTELPLRSTDLYREGCRVLCDEWRQSRKREKLLSAGQRFAIASRLAAGVIFCGRVAIHAGSLHEPVSEQDIRADDLLGGKELFQLEEINVSPKGMVETLDTGLFRSIGRQRFGFSHQTYAEYLAAHHLFERKMPVSNLLGWIFHKDGSEKVVPQLRGVAGWLASLVPEVCQALLAKDPEALLFGGDLVLGEEERADLVRQILRSYDSGALFDERMIRAVGSQLGGARLKYRDLPADLRPYIRDGAKGKTVRRVAISIADLARQTSLQEDLAQIALNEEEPHEVRAIAVFALGRIGDDAVKASLTQLVTDVSVNDPDDELKGGALIATWPNHLTAAELFPALLPRKKSISGLYERFLWSDFASAIQAKDICIALDWARFHVDGSPAEANPLRRAALAITCAAIPLFEEPGVCERLAEIFLKRAHLYSHEQSIAASLLENESARRTIGRVAIDKAPDLWTARLLFRVGLIAEKDIVFLLAELGTYTSISVKEKIAYLIGDIYCATPFLDPDVLDQILQTKRTDAVLFQVFEPLLKSIDLDSTEAAQQKRDYEVSLRRPELEPPPQLHDLFTDSGAGGDGVFADICYRLAGVSPSWESPGEELLPHWKSLPLEHQNWVVSAAERYVKRECPVKDLSWIVRGELPYVIMYGFWALRLLSAKAPAAFDSLGDAVWHDWMPRVFGYPYSDYVSDARHALLLRAAYRKAPDRFLEVLDRFIEGENQSSGTVFVVDRVVPVCPETMALLRAKLSGNKLKQRAFEKILTVLFRAGDDAALQIATDLVTSITADSDVSDGRPLAAAFQLLSRDAVGGWQIVWRAVEENPGFANEVFATLARDPYSKATSDLVKHLRERQLADMYIWLGEHGATAREETTFGVITPQKALVWLGRVVITHLANRGTADAFQQIQRIKESLPDEPLEFVSKSTEDLVRRNTWRPLSPAQLLATDVNGSSDRPSKNESVREKASTRKRTKRKSPDEDDSMWNVKLNLRKWKKEGLSHQEMCKRLANSPRPQQATWRALPWPEAFRKHPNRVRTWISKALLK